MPSACSRVMALKASTAQRFSIAAATRSEVDARVTQWPPSPDVCGTSLDYEKLAQNAQYQSVKRSGKLIACSSHEESPDVDQTHRPDAGGAVGAAGSRRG